jgi:hypothetical protein
MAVSTYKDRLSAAARKGMMGVEPALPGFAITNTTAFLDGKEKVVRQVIQQKPDNEERTTVDPLGARVDDARTGMAGRIAHG